MACEHKECPCTRQTPAEARVEKMVESWNWNASPEEAAADMVSAGADTGAVERAMTKAGFSEQDTRAVINAYRNY